MKLLYHQETEGCRQETVTVTEMELEEGLLTAELPSQLELMPESMREVYYPYENRPAMILSDMDGNIQMTFQLIDKGLKPTETGNAAEAIRKCAEKLYPHSRMSPVHMFDKGEIHVGWFVMGLEQDGESCCHVKAVFPIHGRLFLTTATYPEQDKSKWEVLLKHYFATVHERSAADERSKR